MVENDIFRNLGVEITIAREDDFLKVKETLTRIGIAAKKDNTLYQSCHILHKRGRYAIMHFKELFLLDYKPTEFSDEDLARRNTIVNLLAEWDLVKIVDDSKCQDPVADMRNIKILPYSQKKNWDLRSKYTIGNRS